MSSFDTDVMEDLYYDEAEGPSMHYYDEYDEFGEDEGDELFLDEYDELDEYDAYEEDEFDEIDALDAMEEAVVDALDAEDTDEFFRRLVQGIGRVARGAVNVARRVAPVVGRIARTVAPIASAIPLPWTQAIGRVANVVGRLMADEADEFEALDEMFDLAEFEDIDAVAPIIAGLTIRRTMPGVARLPRSQKKKIVRSVTKATKTVARKQGPKAARAIPGVVRTVKKAVSQRRIPPSATAKAITRTAARVARSPKATRQMAVRAGTLISPKKSLVRRRRYMGGGVCPGCRKQYTLRGPVTISIKGR